MNVVHVPEHAAFRAEKMAKVNLFNVPQLFLDLYCLEPGQEQHPHIHGDAAKIYFVLEGEGTFVLGNEAHVLGPGHAVLAEAGQTHGVRNNGPARLLLLAAMAPNPSHP
jgi:mannose-6-phosphate isomerase-like protein (cupin superfamily)